MCFFHILLVRNRASWRLKSYAILNFAERDTASTCFPVYNNFTDAVPLLSLTQQTV